MSSRTGVSPDDSESTASHDTANRKSNTGRVGRGVARWLKSRRQKLEDLPEPTEEWRLCEVSDWIAHQIEHMQMTGMVHQARRENVPGEGIHSYYRTNPAVYQRAQEILDEIRGTDGILPCDDDSCPGEIFTNPKDTDDVVCKDCGQRHDVDVVRERMRERRGDGS